MNKYLKNFERTYGWAWLLKLTEELYTWDDPMAQKWYDNLKPLAEHLSGRYIEYLPKLAYPEFVHLKELADEHVKFSLGNIVDGDYAGEHWLASFALYALGSR